jgi:hypothetical protein
LLKNKDISLARLRKILFGASTEKTKNVLPEDAESDADPTANEQDEAADGTEATEDKAATHPRGHGRNGAQDYPGATRVSVPHERLQAGDDCPECGKGKVYDTGRPGVVIRIVGQAPLQATVYELQKLRCNLCGKLFTAAAPEGVGPRKYDATTGSMIALLKYGSGLPFNRSRRLQGSLGIPLPAATQWDIVHAKAKVIAPAHEELIRVLSATVYDGFRGGCYRGLSSHDMVEDSRCVPARHEHFRLDSRVCGDGLSGGDGPGRLARGFPRRCGPRR